MSSKPKGIKLSWYLDFWVLLLSLTSIFDYEKRITRTNTLNLISTYGNFWITFGNGYLDLTTRNTKRIRIIYKWIRELDLDRYQNYDIRHWT